MASRFFDGSKRRNWPTIQIWGGAGPTHNIFDTPDFTDLLDDGETWLEHRADGTHLQANPGGSLVCRTQCLSPSFLWVDGGDGANAVNGRYRTFWDASIYYFPTNIPVFGGWWTVQSHYGGPFTGSSYSSLQLSRGSNPVRLRQNVDGEREQTLWGIDLPKGRPFKYARKIKISTNGTGFIEVYYAPTLGDPLRLVASRYNVSTIIASHAGGPNFYKLNNYRQGGINSGTFSFFFARTGLWTGDTTLAQIDAAITPSGTSAGGGGTDAPPPSPGEVVIPKLSTLSAPMTGTAEPAMPNESGDVTLDGGVAGLRVSPSVPRSTLSTPLKYLAPGEAVILNTATWPGLIADQGEVTARFSLNLDGTTRAQIRRRISNVTGEVADQLVCRVEEGNADTGAQSIPFPAGTVAIKVGITSDGRSAFFHYSTDGTRFRKALAAARSFPTANYTARAAAVSADLKIERGTPTVSDWRIDSIVGTSNIATDDTPGAAPDTGTTKARTFSNSVLVFPPHADMLDEPMEFILLARQTAPAAGATLPAAHPIAVAKSNTDPSRFMRINTDRRLQFGDVATGFWGHPDVLVPTGVWFLAVAQKRAAPVAPATSPPNGEITVHVFNFDTGLHARAIAGTVARSAAIPIADAKLVIGRHTPAAAGTEPFYGEIVVGAFRGSAPLLTETEIKSLVGPDLLATRARLLALPGLDRGYELNQDPIAQVLDLVAPGAGSDEIVAARVGTAVFTGTVPYAIGTAAAPPPTPTTIADPVLAEPTNVQLDTAANPDVGRADLNWPDNIETGLHASPYLLYTSSSAGQAGVTQVGAALAVSQTTVTVPVDVPTWFAVRARLADGTLSGFSNWVRVLVADPTAVFTPISEFEPAGNLPDGRRYRWLEDGPEEQSKEYRIWAKVIPLATWNMPRSTSAEIAAREAAINAIAYPAEPNYRGSVEIPPRPGAVPVTPTGEVASDGRRYLTGAVTGLPVGAKFRVRAMAWHD